MNSPLQRCLQHHCRHLWLLIWKIVTDPHSLDNTKKVSIGRRGHMKVKYFRTSTRSIYLICIICKFSWECLWANNWLKFRCHLSWSSSESDFVTRVKFHHVDTYLTHVPQFCHIFRSPCWAPNNATETHDNFYFVTLSRR